MKSKEIWKDIPTYEGIYQISNKGRLKSFKSSKNGIILSIKNKKKDYLSVVLTYKNIKKSIKIHRIVAECFICKEIKNKQIHHKDNNKQNNEVSNLLVLTPKEHSLITIKENPNILKNMIKYNKNRITPILQYDMNNNLLAEYKSAKIASYATGVCKRNIYQVASKNEYKKGKIRKQAGGFIWKWKY